jgi:hypothetical protein
MNLRRRFAHGIEYPENEEKTECQEETEQSEPEGRCETNGQSEGDAEVPRREGCGLIAKLSTLSLISAQPV